MQSRKNSVQIRVLPEDRIVLASHGETLLEALLRSKVAIDNTCGGFGTCTTCRVFIESGLEALDTRNELEAERADERGFAPNERLSCQVHVRFELMLRLPK